MGDIGDFLAKGIQVILLGFVSIQSKLCHNLRIGFFTHRNFLFFRNQDHFFLSRNRIFSAPMNKGCGNKAKNQDKFLHNMLYTNGVQPCIKIRCGNCQIRQIVDNCFRVGVGVRPSIPGQGGKTSGCYRFQFPAQHTFSHQGW